MPFNLTGARFLIMLHSTSALWVQTYEQYARSLWLMGVSLQSPAGFMKQLLYVSELRGILCPYLLLVGQIATSDHNKVQ